MTLENNPAKPNHLVEAAKEAGAYEVVKPVGWDKTKSIDQLISNQKISFFPDLPKIEWLSLVEKTFRILAIRIVDDWDNSKYGMSSFPLLLIDFEDGRKGTTLGSGKAILKQIRKLESIKGIPVKVMLVMKAPESPTGQPYYFLDGVK